MAKEYFGIDADVSIYNSGGIRAEMSAGDLTLGDVYATYPFDNVLSVITMKGRDLKILFEYVAASGGLPVNSNVRLVIHDKAVKSVTVGGNKIDDERIYTVATIDYLVNLGRYGMQNALSRRDSPEIIRDLFAAYLRHMAAENGGSVTYFIDGRVVIE
jgi:2',3'-cyclic-nucleotide 2'-phosphodiesterase (5'-nucleotidase family)